MKKGFLTKKSAFTLAETLMTLIVIGVISVITLPALKTTVDSKTKESLKSTFNNKFKQGLSNMQIHGALAKDYNTTADFVDAMKKYMNISNTCAADNLTNCFIDVFQDNTSAKKYTTANLRTSADINASFPQTSSLMGIVFADGSRAIISYKIGGTGPIANIYDTTADTTTGFAMIYDINGKDAPNMIGEDIFTINLWADDKEVEITEVFSPTPLSIADCKEWYKKGVPMHYICDNENDYYAGAAKECFEQGYRLPTSQELTQFAERLYGASSGSNLKIKDQALRIDLDVPNAGVVFFSSDDTNGTNVISRVFTANTTCAAAGYLGCYSSHGVRTRAHKAFCIKN